MPPSAPLLLCFGTVWLLVRAYICWLALQQFVAFCGAGKGLVLLKRLKTANMLGVALEATLLRPEGTARSNAEKPGRTTPWTKLLVADGCGKNATAGCMPKCPDALYFCSVLKFFGSRLRQNGRCC